MSGKFVRIGHGRADGPGEGALGHGREPMVDRSDRAQVSKKRAPTNGYTPSRVEQSME